MATRSIIAGIAILACAASVVAAQSPPPETPTPTLAEQEQAEQEQVEPAIDRVRLREDGEDRLTIPVEIEGNGPYDFLIDTGAEGTILSDRLVGRLGIETSGRANIVSVASRAEVDTVRLSSFAFAERDIGRLTTPVLRYDHLGVDGILGLDALQDLRVLIDFRKGTMDVEDAHEKPSGGRYDIIVRARRLKGQMIITDAEIDGIDVAVIVDTGAQYSIGNLALLRALRPSERHLLQGTDVLGSLYEGRVGYLDEMRIGRMVLGNMPTAFLDGPAFDQLGFGDRPALLLGVGTLRGLERLAIDFRSGKVLFDLPRGVGRSPGLLRGGGASRLDDRL